MSHYGPLIKLQFHDPVILRRSKHGQEEDRHLKRNVCYVSRCGCHEQLSNTYVIYRHKDESTRLISEAENMAREPNVCVSKPSVASSEKDLQFLGNGGHDKRQ